jgi:hypothetical protein
MTGSLRMDLERKSHHNGLSEGQWCFYVDGIQKRQRRKLTLSHFTQYLTRYRRFFDWGQKSLANAQAYDTKTRRLRELEQKARNL